MAKQKINPTSKYQSFWTRFHPICTKDHSMPIQPVGCPFKYDFSDNKVKLDEVIYLHDWKHHSGDASKTVDIVVNGYDLVDPYNCNILESNVSVNYFTSTMKKGRKLLALIESMHYDFKGITSAVQSDQIGHPLFHAHMSSGLIKDGMTRFNIEKSSTDKRLRGIRIPTAHMSLIPVLISLVADHAKRENKKNKATNQIERYVPVLDDIKSTNAISNVPKACCTGLQDKIKNDNASFRGHLWYPEFMLS